MNELKVFNFEEKNVRTFTVNDEPHFVGRDVAEILGYKKPSNAVGTHVDDEDKTTSLIQGTGSNYKSNTVLINESGLYALIFASQLDSAKRFKRWVTSEVLPQIRKTGKYEEPKSPMEMLELQFKAMKETNKRVETVEKDVVFLKEEVKLDPGEYNYLTSHISRNVKKAIHSFGFANTREVKRELFRDINRGLNDFCEVATRTQLKQKHFDKAMEYIQIWVHSTPTKLKVEQLSMDLDKEG